MERRATYDDVNLILRLYEMRREDRMRQARQWFAASCRPKVYDDLKTICPPGSDANASYRMVTTYWEMVAGFVVSGVLHQDLFFQSGRELLFVWERIKDIVPEARRVLHDEAQLGNMEQVAQAYARWMNQRAAKSYEAFSARVRS
jgi:hypothetical protein